MLPAPGCIGDGRAADGAGAFHKAAPNSAGSSPRIGGDYDTAEQRYTYTQALQIEERLGNHAVLATNRAAPAMLMAERGNDSHRVRRAGARDQVGDARLSSNLEPEASADAPARLMETIKSHSKPLDLQDDST